MKKSTVILCLVGSLCLLCGCDMHKLAGEDLDRLNQVQAALSSNYDQFGRLMLRLEQTQSRRMHYLDAKLALATTKPDAVLDQLEAEENSSGVIRDNLRDQLAFLQAQSEKTKALGLTLRIYVEGNKGIIDLLAARIKANASQPQSSGLNQPTTAADIEPLLSTSGTRIGGSSP